MKRKPGNPNFGKTIGFKKGDPRAGRPKGRENETTRMVKDAIVLAAEHSKLSKGTGLVGYITWLADNRPELYAGLIGRLIPLQVKGKFEAQVEHTIKAKPESQMSVSEVAEYYAKLRQLPPSSAPLVIEHDDGEVATQRFDEAAE